MRLPVHSAGARPDAAASRPTLPPAKALARLRRRLRVEAGFTIIEVLVATLVITIGLLTAYLALNVAVHSSTEVRQREEGISLARQITEDARSIPYSQLSTGTIVSQLQAFPGLANVGSGSTWTIQRPANNGYTFTVTASVTYLHDPKDTLGGTGATDVKQFSVTISWTTTYQGASHSYTESTIISRAGQDPGLQASNLQLSSPACTTAGIVTASCPNAPVITSTAITPLQFSVTSPAGTSAVIWTLNGVKQSAWSGSAPSSGTTWVSNNWSLTGVSDGTYTIGAQAEDANGVDGPAVSMQVRLIRNVPSAPTLTGYGFNTGLPTGGGVSTGAEFQWSSNPELNVVGYRLYYNTTPTATLVCQTNTSSSYPATCNGGRAWCSSITSCIDLSPPATNASNLSYSVKALYYDVNNNLQEGTARTVALASGNPTAPNAPVSLTVATLLDNTATVTWPVSVGGAPVNFYRIYRDGSGYINRYDVVPASSCSVTCTYHDLNRSEGHRYAVTAVGGTALGADMDESVLSPGQDG